jgi:hypothetical protein
MTAMIAHTLPTLTETGEEGIKLRFAKQIWNDCEPPTREATTSSPKLKLNLKVAEKRNRRPTPIKTENELKAKVTKRSPTQPKQCRVKVTRFQYGGPDAKVGGQYKNSITLLEPCIRPTCTNCWKWYDHLMRSPMATDISTDDARGLQHPETSPLSPIVDPGILNDKRQLHKNRRIDTNDILGLAVPTKHIQNTTSLTPALTPVDHRFATHFTFSQTAHLPTTHSSLATHVTRQYKVSLPTPLLSHLASPTSPKTYWRDTPRQRYTARLTFSSSNGRAKFKTLAHQQARKGIKRERDRLRRLQKEIMRDFQQHLAEGEGGVGNKPKRRRRYRLKLVFVTKKGRQGYRRLVGRYLK